MIFKAANSESDKMRYTVGKSKNIIDLVFERDSKLVSFIQAAGSGLPTLLTNVGKIVEVKNRPYYLHSKAYFRWSKLR